MKRGRDRTVHGREFPDFVNSRFALGNTDCVDGFLPSRQLGREDVANPEPITPDPYVPPCPPYCCVKELSKLKTYWLPRGCSVGSDTFDECRAGAPRRLLNSRALLR